MMEVDQNSDRSSLLSLIEVSENEAENGNGSEVFSLIEVDESEGEKEEEKYGNEVELKNIKRSVRNWRKCLGCNEKKISIVLLYK